MWVNTTKAYREAGRGALVPVAGGKVVTGGVTFAVNDSGQLVLTGLPTTDSGMVGAPWISSGAFAVRVDATAT